MDLPMPVLIALVSTGIGMLLLTAQGSTAKLGSVPHRQWPAEGGAASVAADRTPVVLKGSPVTQWAALEPRSRRRGQPALEGGGLRDLV